MTEIEATWDAFMREVRIGLGGQPQGKYGHRTLIRLSKQETEDEIDWANENYGSRAPMPDFKRPRHAD